MERLTARKKDGGAYVKGLLDFEIPEIIGLMLQSVVDRLAAYEDTGLEPEDIISAQDMFKIAGALHELNAYKDLGPIDRLRELAQADREGRVVVLDAEKIVYTDAEIAEITGYKCPICKNHSLCHMPHNKPLCGETYTHFEALGGGGDG